MASMFAAARSSDDEKNPKFSTTADPTAAHSPDNQSTTSDEKSTESFSEAQSVKVTHIREACLKEDLDALVELSTTSGGLIQDELRRDAWPLLLGCRSHLTDSSWSTLPPHRDEGQVNLDVNRSFVYYPKGESERQINLRKEDLSDLIVQVLRQHPKLCYFQGYHDIVQVLLLVLGPELAAPAVARLSLLKLRDFMLPTLTAAVDQLHLIPPILYAADPELCRHLPLNHPFFALSATLTLYAHNIEEYSDIARLYDFLLAREAVMPVYLFAAIILARKKELLEMPADEPEIIHIMLSKLPHPLHLENLIFEAISLYKRLPPQSLPFHAWNRISRYSVLKTAKDCQALTQQSLEDGERLWEKHSSQVWRQEMIKKTAKQVKSNMWVYRRPAGALGIAIAVGVFALWLGRTGLVPLNLRDNGNGMIKDPFRRFLQLLSHFRLW
ncbi:hypothetical protein M501DRAFT_995892 [Patellaria atrata CBS 101060]|uniref:Rab-GAP TBC domain-containing protein n=1 Tax=Patellaria atrata CBS 101060 TaxID=1346257 RepID=A0A9P4S7B0_9PEZI|nr:hypothetical protein M501DRAFT_995892 [Patellaria atrata CBS 101060]